MQQIDNGDVNIHNKLTKIKNIRSTAFTTKEKNKESGDDFTNEKHRNIMTKENY